MIKHYNIPVFIPELACPFRCVYCNQEKISGRKLIPSDKEIISNIESHLKSFKQKQRNVNIAFFGGSFTGIPKDQQEHYLQLAQPFIETGQINGIQLSTRPDYINEEILDLLKKYNVNTIELGAQSLDEVVLKQVRRGHTVDDVAKSAALIKERGFKLGLQMMIGLPGDTLERAKKTAAKIIELKADNTRIYPSLIIKDTAMHLWYKQGKYKPLSLNEAVEWTSEIYPMFEYAGVKVLRVGLHPSEGLLSGEELIAGPFHVSFKELVLTQIWKKKLKNLFVENNSKKLIINVPEKELNYAIGYNSSNKSELKKMYKSVVFKVASTFSYQII